jgi:mutator protein MutT
MYLQLVSTVVVVYCENMFLLVRRTLDDEIFPGKWQSAGGKMEPGETLEETAVRELAEEIGVNVDPENLLFVMSYSWQKSFKEPTRLGIILLARLSKKIKDIDVVLDAELCEYGWFTMQKAEKLDTIGKDSPTGTFAQLKKAQEVVRHLAQ